LHKIEVKSFANHNDFYKIGKRLTGILFYHFLYCMSLISSQQLHRLRKPHVNSTCIGCSACVAISSDVFELDEQ